MSKHCDHYWNYDQGIYSTTKDNVCKVHRWCDNCGVHQWAYTGQWRNGMPPEGYEDCGWETEDMEVVK